MHTTINYVVFNENGSQIGIVATRHDLQQLLKTETTPAKSRNGLFSLSEKHVNSLQEVDIRQVEETYRVTMMIQLKVVHYDVYNRDSKYVGHISTRQDLLGILEPGQIIGKYESFALDPSDNNSLQEVDLTAIEDKLEMTFVLLTPVGHNGFSAG